MSKIKLLKETKPVKMLVNIHFVAGISGAFHQNSESSAACSVV
jgi:hypothetical protein